MKRRITALIAAVVLILSSSLFCFAAGLTHAPTPVGNAELLFTRKLGSGYKNAPTPVATGKDCIYVAAGNKMYKLDAETGETLASVEMESVSTYTAVAPLYNGDTVYMPLDDGIVQAFSASDLAPVWTYTDPLGGQGLCPIICRDGYLYTGFWNGETDNANFVCLPAQGSGKQKAVWTFSSMGGFYRTAALIRGDYVIVGSDNGQQVDQPDAPSHIYSINRQTGKPASQLTTAGDIRAGVSCDAATGFCYTVSKSGELYRFKFDISGGRLYELTSVPLSGSSTVTPIPYSGRLYVGCSDGRKGRFLVMDAASLRTIWSAELPGSPQGDMLLSTAYEYKDGRRMIYSTYNAPPGGIYEFEDAPGQTKAVAREFFTPPENMGQYCFCPVTADGHGRIYYKNDSGTVFALAGNREAERNVIFLLSSYLKLFRQIITFLRGTLAQ